MEAHNIQGGWFLTITSGIFGFISIAAIQPYLSVAASLVAICSGVLAIRKHLRK